jgi:hypothetical protein
MVTREQVGVARRLLGDSQMTLAFEATSTHRPQTYPKNRPRASGLPLIDCGR